MFLQCLEFFWQPGIANFIGVEIRDVDPDPVFDFAWAKLMQESPPTDVLAKILGLFFGNHNLTPVAAIHASLRDVDAGAGQVGPLIYIDNSADRSAVDSH